MKENVNKKIAPQDQLIVEVPDQAHQLLLLEFARAQGLKAFVPGRSRKRVALAGPAEKAKEAVIAARPLGYALEAKRLQALRGVLAENSLKVPPGLAAAISKFGALGAGVAIKN